MPTKRPDTSRLERRVVLGLGCAIVAALLFLVLSGDPIARTLALPLRFLLALAAAIIGAFLPGAALRIGFSGRGLALRAAGAAAFFTLVWLGGPSLGEA